MKLQKYKEQTEFNTQTNLANAVQNIHENLSDHLLNMVGDMVKTAEHQRQTTSGFAQAKRDLEEHMSKLRHHIKEVEEEEIYYCVIQCLKVLTMELST